MRTPANQTQLTAHGRALSHIKSAILALVAGTTALSSWSQCLQWQSVLLNCPTIPCHPSPRAGHVMAFDSDRGDMILYGGESQNVLQGDTWVYNETNGASWERVLLLATSPPPLSEAAMVYDSARKRFVLFGGVDSSQYFDQTWVYTNNGVLGAWALLNPPNRPPARAGHAMVFDTQRNVVVLFGGENLQLPGQFTFKQYEDTWEFDGNNWTQRSPANHPVRRVRHSMAWDGARQVTVLFGGTRPPDSDPFTIDEYNDTWEWNGTDWVQVQLPSVPLARQQHALAYDSQRGKVVMFGGTSGNLSGMGDDTDDYSGPAGWSSLFTSGPPPRARHAMVYDSFRGRMVLFGGASGSTQYGDTWELIVNGPTFTQRPLDTNTFPCATVSLTATATGVGPLQYQWLRDGFPLSDEGRISGATTNKLVINGVRVSDDGAYQLAVISACGTNTSSSARLKVLGTWVQQFPPLKPAGRFNTALTYDADRKVTVMFGGTTLNTFGAQVTSRETFEWDGNTWLLRAMSGPTPRSGHTMVYDPDRKQLVLFGGSSTGSPYDTLGDTWEYDGLKWKLRATNGPPSRTGAAMAYDNTTHKTVLYGGVRNGNVRLYDTWEYDGNLGTWSQVQTGLPAGTLLSQWKPTLAFDSLRQKRVMFDYYSVGSGSPELRVFEWDGAQWVRQSPLPDPDRITGRTPTPVTDFAVAYDSQRGMVVLNNGQDTSGRYPNATWSYDGTYWRLLSLSGPGGLGGGALSYDSSRNALVEFGGWRNDVVGYYWDQTWERVRADVPEFIQQPVAKVLPFGLFQNAIQLAVAVRGLPPYQFQWRKGGVPLTESSQYVGATNGVLTVVGPVSGLFDVVVSGSCGQALSQSVLLPQAASPIALHGQTQLTIANAQNSVAVRWPDPTAQLYSAPTVTGTWSHVVSATSPYSSPIAAAPTFFQLQGGSGCGNRPAGVVTWLRAEGNANDYAGTNNGSLLGGLGFTNGQVGQAFNFTNNGQGLSLAASASLNLATNEGFTIEMWINPADVNSPRPLAEWSASSGFLVGTFFWIGGSFPGSLYASLNANGDPAAILVSPPGLLASNVWQHVAFVYHAHDPVFASMELYLNGQSVGAQSVASPVLQTQYPLSFGVRFAGGYYYRGLMDEVTLYSRALSDDELQPIYHAGHAGKCFP